MAWLYITVGEGVAQAQFKISTGHLYHCNSGDKDIRIPFSDTVELWYSKLQSGYSEIHAKGTNMYGTGQTDWYIGSSTDKKIDYGGVDRYITVYGTASKCTLTRNYNGSGRDPDYSQYTVGATVYVSNLSTPSWSGHIFVGWGSSPSATAGMGNFEIKKDTTIYAVWKAYAGTITSVTSRYAGTSVNQNQGVVTVNYNLSNAGTGTWYVRITRTISDSAIAVYENRAYINSSSSSISITIQSLYTTDPNSNVEFNAELYDPDHNKKATMKFTRGSKPYYTITFIANGSRWRQDSVVPFSSFPMPNNYPTKTDYVFVGWTDDSGDTAPNSYYNPGNRITVERSITLWALWHMELFQWSSDDTTNVAQGKLVSSVITAAKWNELQNKVRALYIATKNSNITFTAVGSNDSITAADFNSVRGIIAVLNNTGGVVDAAVPHNVMYSYYFSNDNRTVSGKNSLKDALNNAIRAYTNL